MRIFQRETNRVFDNIELFLTVGELQQLSSYAKQLINKPLIHHCHLTEENETGFSKEITIAIVTEDNINEFDERSREVIQNNK